jgi:hypothetical protein|tara:strand:+ start:2890 stop:3627 length:738 start_codon:yes stop_codon:yes gene_type:complete
MGLETGTYIDSLNSSNPTAGDAVSEGDDHLRLIKSTVKATFPNLSNAVTSTQAELNLLDGVTANTTELNYVDITTLGTVEASKAVTADANKDVTGIRNLTITGAFSAGSGIVTMADVYPVGSIYINAAVTTNPATLLGFGTWTAFGSGRMMVGYNASDSDFDALQETGGAKTHTLSTAELPSHTHTIASNNSGSNNNLHHSNNSFVAVGDGSSSTATVTSNATGSGSAHSILNPYIVAYMWRRTA